MLRIVKNVNKYFNYSISKNKYSTINGLNVKSFYSTTATSTATEQSTTQNFKTVYKLKDGSIKEIESEYVDYDEKVKEENNNFENECGLTLENNENKLQTINSNDLLKKIKEEMNIDLEEKLEGMVERSPQVFSSRTIIEDRFQYTLQHRDCIDTMMKPFQTFYKIKSHNKAEIRELAMSHPQKFHFLPYSPLLYVFNWGSLDSIRFLFNFIAKKENFKSLDDWYRLDLNKISEKYHLSKITYLVREDIDTLLTYAYPYHNWDFRKFKTHFKSLRLNTIQRILKEHGYLSKIELLPLVKPVTPFPISLYHQNIYKKELRLATKKKFNIKLIGLAIPEDYLIVHSHLSLYKLEDNNNDNNNNNNNDNDYNNNDNSNNNSDNNNIYLSRKGFPAYKEELKRLSPYKLDKEKIYEMDFNNNKPYLVNGEITDTIDLICSIHPYLKPWLFKYQGMASERETSQLFIKEIEEKFNIVEPSQWYNLEYSKELEELLPKEWYHCLTFIEYLNIKYPSFIFQSNQFKDKEIYKKFYYTHTTRYIKSVVDEFFLSKKIKGVPDLQNNHFHDQQKVVKRLRQELELPFTLNSLLQLFPIIYPRNELSTLNVLTPKVVSDLNRPKKILLEMVSKENLEMEDLYKLKKIGSEPRITHIQTIIRYSYPEYDWVSLKFPMRSASIRKGKDLKNKLGLEYYNYLKIKYSLAHPLDLISIISTIDSSSVDGLANQRFIKFGLFNTIAESIDIKDFPTVNSLPFDDSMINSHFRKLLNINDDEDIGMNINRFTLFSELEKHVKK
ncbi:hypothetical protein ACTFIU_004398 [Dictyostelium citrinum]